jgi:GntR family transcriptional regulator
MRQQKEVDWSSPVPAYHQIFENLSGRISEGEWKEGQKLPSEKTLAELYAASRVTIRLALNSLERKGAIRKVRGSGSIVQRQEKPFIHNFSLPSTICDKLGHKGISLDAELVGLEAGTAKPMVAELLKLSDERRVVLVKRVFTRSGRPLALSESWIAESLVPEIVERGLIEGHLSNTLAQRYQLLPVRIENTMEVTRLSGADARLLEAFLDMPVIAVASVSFLPFDVPLEYSRTLWLADRIKFRFNLDRNGEI